MPGRLFVMLATVGLTLALTPTSVAAPPTIVSLSQTQGHVQVTWTLPADGSTSWRVQVARSPQTGGDGAFFSENIVDDDFVSDFQTSWTSVDPLPAGIYFVHVADSNLTCSGSRDDCFAEQWSSPAQINVPLNVAYAYGSLTRAGKLIFGRAIAEHVFRITVRNADGTLPQGTTGLCLIDVPGVVFPRAVKRGIYGDAFVCAWYLQRSLAGKRLDVEVHVFFRSASVVFTKSLRLRVVGR
jgi:hypothetical protein